MGGVRLLLLVVLIAVLGPIQLVWGMLSRRSPIPALFLRLAGIVCGVRIAVSGQRRRGDVLFVSNHLSWLDIMVLGGFARSAFVAKAEIERWPLVGWLADQNRTLYVDRSARHRASEQVQELRNALAQGHAVTLFPEGTTNNGATLLPFVPSLFQAVTPAPPGVSIQPVYLDYGVDATDVAWVDPESALDNAKRMLSRTRPLRVTIHYLDPLPDEATAHRKIAAAQCRAAIEARMAQCRHG